MDWLDQKYALQLSPRLERFTPRNGGYNFRCPICGDSKKSKSKSRGWIYDRGKGTKFHCHNCGVHKTFSSFLEQFDPLMYGDWRLEKITQNRRPMTELETFVVKMKPKFSDTPFDSIKKISQLKPDHPAKLYVESRLLPNYWHSVLRYSPKFFAFSNKVIPGKFSDGALFNDHPRLIIPFVNKLGQIHAFQGRSFDPAATAKYITILVDENLPKMFGIDRLDKDSPQTFVFEGPIDAMFIDSAISSAGGDLAQTVGALNLPRHKFTIVYDNEPRAPKTRDKLAKTIKAGYPVVIWPRTLEPTDINDMIKAGMTQKEITTLMKENTFSGLAAEFELSKWSMA
jgi:predicted RNA-binding Zn-ribbon protein involved in translation (DUF1610 family)